VYHRCARDVLADLSLLQALKQLLLETDKRENQGLPKVQPCSRIIARARLTLPKVSCVPSDGLSAHLAYGEAQSMILTVWRSTCVCLGVLLNGDSCAAGQ
jgi:hypothetical protein